MSRFKENRRINEAIKHRNSSELLWALEYCQSRLSIATMKEHIKHWNKFIERIKSALSETDDE